MADGLVMSSSEASEEEMHTAGMARRGVGTLSKLCCTDLKQVGKQRCMGMLLQ